ncbi:hypothetical protein F5Y09DRAFT_352229 [Xylaria sp. FL1042]|nr:hypothetical protein F5Y09DRAFT_352229 [Xylaria sp. FL1042]
MAYYNPIYQDVHKDPTIRIPPPGPTYGSTIEGYAGTPYASIPLSRSPRSRPFLPFINAKPTPPRRHFPPAPPSAAELARKEAEEEAEKAWAKRQRKLYAMPGAEARPDFRRWNGRTMMEGPVRARGGSSVFAPAVGGFVKSTGFAVGAIAEAVRAEIARERAAYAARVARARVYASELRYQLSRLRREGAVEVGGTLVRVQPILFVLLFLYVFGVVVAQLGMAVAGDWVDDGDDDLMYVLLEEYKTWWFAT